MKNNVVNNKFNKATYTALVGACITIAAGIWPDLTSQVTNAAQTILVTLAVIFIPNKES